MTRKAVKLKAARGRPVEAGVELIDQLRDGDPHLLHRVTLTDGHGPVVQGVEVDRHAEGRADLVLAAVAAPDVAAGLVVLDPEAGLAQEVEHLAGGRDQLLLLGQRHHGDLHRRDVLVQPQHDSGLALHLVLVVGVEQASDQDPVHAHRRLDDPGKVALVGFRVEVGEVLAGVLLVRAEVEIGAARDALQLAPAEGKRVLDIR
jgi:hypothetical protein